ncbi:MAG TPA: hypothetical protein VK207_11125 [Bacteroidales bacterium]|nr:hypothetical protein [Bacteroidales bacterium]
MRSIFIKTCLSFAILSISIMSFGQQGVQNDSLSKSKPANSGMQTQQNQNMQNNTGNSDSQGQASQNAGVSSLLQPADSYPVNQNLEINMANLVDPVTNSLVHSDAAGKSDQGVQGQGTRENQGDAPQTLPADQGDQPVQGNTGKGVSNQNNAGTNNNQGVPNKKETKSRDNSQKDQGIQNDQVKQGQSTKKP